MSKEQIELCNVLLTFVLLVTLLGGTVVQFVEGRRHKRRMKEMDRQIDEAHALFIAHMKANMEKREPPYLEQ